MWLVLGRAAVACVAGVGDQSSTFSSQHAPASQHTLPPPLHTSPHTPLHPLHPLLSAHTAAPLVPPPLNTHCCTPCAPSEHTLLHPLCPPQALYITARVQGVPAQLLMEIRLVPGAPGLDVSFKSERADLAALAFEAVGMVLSS